MSLTAKKTGVVVITIKSTEIDKIIEIPVEIERALVEGNITLTPAFQEVKIGETCTIKVEVSEGLNKDLIEARLEEAGGGKGEMDFTGETITVKGLEKGIMGILKIILTTPELPRNDFRAQVNVIE